MQAGFTLVETDQDQKNAGNIIMKNLMDFALVKYCLGFGLLLNVRRDPIMYFIGILVCFF
jgi:hypothetical protein